MRQRMDWVAIFALFVMWIVAAGCGHEPTHAEAQQPPAEASAAQLPAPPVQAPLSDVRPPAPEQSSTEDRAVEAPSAVPVEQPSQPPATPGGVPVDGTLNVVGVFPVEGEVVRDQIVVYFDKPIAAPASPLTITPDMPHQIRVGSNYILVEPAAKTVILDVALSPEIRSTDGLPLNSAQTHLTFLMESFKAGPAQIIESAPERLVVGLPFTLPVSLDALKANISVVTADGQAVPFELGSGTTPTVFRVTFAPAPPQGSRINLNPALTDATGRAELGTQPPIPIPQAEPLLVVRALWTEQAEGTCRARLDFNMAVDATKIQQQMQVYLEENGSVLPFTAYTPEGAGDRVIEVLVEGVDPTVPHKVHFKLPAGYVNADGTALTADLDTTLVTRVRAAKIQNMWWHEDWQNPEKGLILSLELGAAVQKADIKGVTVEPPVQNMQWDVRYRQLIIRGDWQSKRSYKVTVNVKDKVLTAGTTSEQVPPYVGFARKEEWYFPRRSGLELPLTTRNVEKATITLYRMFPSNAAVAARDLRDERYGTNFPQWSEELSKTEIKIANVPDRIVETPLDLDLMFPKNKHGLFYLVASGEKGGQGSKFVLWTNMGALAHWRGTELDIFAHDLFSLAPMKMAKVSVFSAKNQLLGSANTGEDGIGRLGPFDTNLGAPGLALIEHGEDFTLLKLENRPQDASGIPQDLSAYNRKGYDAFIYADRELYRPGETIHAHWMVRTNYGDAAPQMPLIMSVFKPNGTKLLEQATALSALGTGGFDLPTQETYPTGKYKLQLAAPGSKGMIGACDFSLEEFVPNRIKATVTIDSPRWVGTNTYPVHLNTQHLFGAPAADRKADVSVILRREPIKFDAWPGFTFGNDSDYLPETVSLGEQVTDGAGNAQFTFSHKPSPKMTFPVKTLVVGRVFELGGRPVATKTEGIYFPSDICLGLALSKADGGGVNVDVAAMTPDEQPAAIEKVQVTLERQVWNYYVRRYYEHNEPKWSESFEAVETRETPIVNGRGATTFTPQDYGYFRVRVHSDKTPQYSAASLYSYGTGFEPTDPARPSLIKVTPDKDSYNVGEEAVVRIESPFDGQGIVVVQGEEIQDMIPVSIQGQAGTLRIPITRKQTPNVWIEATVIHAVKADKKQVYPFSSFAVTNLRVDDPERKLNVALSNLPEEMRPSTEAKFEVDIKDSAGNPVEAELTLAAVDEGIHGITGYKSPDPYVYLMRSRKPDLRRAHYYDKVAYDFEATAPGGDALLKGLLKRASAPDQNWIKPVALWSGTVITDASGHAVVTMQLPEFNGQLRLDAVACTGTAAGSQSADMFVRRPYILQTSMPRFLLPNDNIQCRATVHNNSDNPCTATITWTSSGAILPAPGNQSLDVPAHGEASCIAPFTAGPVTGQGEIQWQATITDAAGRQIDQLKEAAPVPVRPSAAYQSQHELIVLKPGETREFKYTNVIENAESELELTVSGSPLLQLQECLRYVIHYPYGCGEQITSQLMPMFALRQVWSVTGQLVGAKANVDDAICGGITRLFSMQSPDGGLSMWPGGTKNYTYGSIYALHFLTLVKNGRELPVPEVNYELLRQYVKRQLADWTKTDPDTMYRRAYATYVLALGGDTEAIAQIPRFDNVKVPQHGRYLLAAALAQHTHDIDRVKMYLATAPTEVMPDRTAGGSLNSEIRNTAVELLALQQMKINPEEQAQKAQALVSFIETQRYGTTQESAFVIAALASYLSNAAGDIRAAAANITTPQGHEQLSGPGVYKKTQQGPGATFVVVNTGPVALYANITTRGVPMTPPEPVSEGGLKVKRDVYTATGATAPGEAYKQPASYIVDIILTSEFDRQNIIVADLLPAGFEIENPRLAPEGAPAGLGGNPATPSYVDLRDDRVLLAFDSLPKGTSHYYYVVRAVTPGTYQHPAVQAECMYDPGINARSAIGTVKVE